MYFRIRIDEEQDILLLSSQNSSKISLHLLLRPGSKKEYVFRNNNELGYFVKSIVENLKNLFNSQSGCELLDISLEELSYLFYTKNDKIQCVIDIGVYTKNRLFRTLGSCKKGRTDIFTYMVVPKYLKYLGIKARLLYSLVTYFRPGHFLSYINFTVQNEKIPVENKSITVSPNNVVQINPILDIKFIKYIENFIVPGTIQKIVPGKINGFFILQLKNYRYCTIISREHSSNRQYIVLDTKKLQFSVRCYECKTEFIEQHFIVFSEDFIEDF